MDTAFQDGIALTLIEIVGDSAFKADNPLLGFAGYNALGFYLWKALRGKSLALVNSNWDAISNVATVGVGYYLFDERFTNREWLGLGMISAGLWLIN